MRIWRAWCLTSWAPTPWLQHCSSSAADVTQEHCRCVMAVDRDAGVWVMLVNSRVFVPVFFRDGLHTFVLQRQGVAGRDLGSCLSTCGVIPSHHSIWYSPCLSVLACLSPRSCRSPPPPHPPPHPQASIDEVNNAQLRHKLPFGAKAVEPRPLDTYQFSHDAKVCCCT